MTFDQFQACLNQDFITTLADNQPYLLKLVQVEIRGTPHRPELRQPFALIFSNPRTDAYLPQGTYPLAHPQLGELAIFIVPLGADAQGMRYEAIFS